MLCFSALRALFAGQFEWLSFCALGSRAGFFLNLINIRFQVCRQVRHVKKASRKRMILEALARNEKSLKKSLPKSLIKSL